MSTLMRKRMMDRAYGNRRRRRAKAPPKFIIMKPEQKCHKYNIAHNTSTGTNQFLNEIPVGVDNNKRIGGRIQMKWMEVVIRNVTNTSPLRLVLFVPRNPTNTPSTGLLDPNDRDQFWVIKDWWLHTGTLNNSLGNTFIHSFPYGLNAIYGSSAASDIEKGKLYLGIYTDSAVTVDGSVALYFTDV